MSATMLLSAALSILGPPLTVGELAGVHVGAARTSTAELQPIRALASRPASVVGEQLDVWWSEQGAALIAQAVRPVPTPPAGLDFAAFAAGRIDLRVTISQLTVGR